MSGPRSADDVRSALRSEGRAARRALQGTERTTAEVLLAAHLASLVLAPGACIGVYVSDDGEPNLEPFVAVLRSRGHGVALPVPAADDEDFTMEFRLWLEGDELESGRFGIPCPPERAAVLPDLLLVPLVRFDADGNRMGRGAGFYDRWLHQHGATAIGTAFEVQRADLLEPQPHDVAMRAVITELGIRFVRPTGVT